MQSLSALAAQRALPFRSNPSVEAHANWLVERITRALQAAIQERGRATLALSGGRGPAPFLRALNRVELAWERVCVTLADERWVPPEHADSNAGLLWRCMPEVMPRVVWTPLYHGLSPEQDAARSSAALAELMPLDVLVLGMGTNGHTASLFPGAPGLADLLSAQAPALCMATESTEGAPRLTLTGAGLNSARTQLLEIRGEDKAAVLAAALSGQHPQWPVSAFLRNPLEIVYGPDGD
ncbi:MAG: 6-phosphogluconolactonase [Halopseudomonas sp.]|uniref:6-phosphogluconolactonase n=1 Tax=Halopseudomonas sp. TaxID=2901191 RepID=UPI0030022430